MRGIFVTFAAGIAFHYVVISMAFSFLTFHVGESKISFPGEGVLITML